MILKPTVDKLMEVLVGTSSALILVGAIFRLQHWKYGSELLWTGLIAYLILSSIEISRLRKIIRRQEKTSKNTMPG